MTAFTPNEAFPYPTAGDAFADQPDGTGFVQQSRDFALAVQAKILAQPSFIERTPMVKMSCAGQPIVAVAPDIPNTFRVVYDTVEVDTEGAVDLDRSPYGPFLTRRGNWVAIATTHTTATTNTTPAATAQQCTLDQTAGALDLTNAFTPIIVKNDDGVSETFHNTSAHFFVNGSVVGSVPTVSTLWKKFNILAPHNLTTQQFLYSSLFVFWAGDLG